MEVVKKDAVNVLEDSKELDQINSLLLKKEKELYQEHMEAIFVQLVSKIE